MENLNNFLGLNHSSVLKLMIFDLFQSDECLSVVLSEFQKNISIPKQMERKKNMGLLLWSVFDGIRNKHNGKMNPCHLEISSQCAANLRFIADTETEKFWRRVLNEAIQEDYHFLANFISFI